MTSTKSRHDLDVGDEVTLRYGQSGVVVEVRDDRERSLRVQVSEGAILATSVWEVIEWRAGSE